MPSGRLGRDAHRRELLSAGRRACQREIEIGVRFRTPARLATPRRIPYADLGDTFRMKTFLAGLFIASASLVSAQEAAKDDPDLVRLLRYLDAVELHTPGEPDAVAAEIAGWSRSMLVTVAADLSRMSLFLQKSKEDAPGPLPTIELHNRRFTLAEVEA